MSKVVCFGPRYFSCSGIWYDTACTVVGFRPNKTLGLNQLHVYFLLCRLHSD